MLQAFTFWEEHSLIRAQSTVLLIKTEGANRRVDWNTGKGRRAGCGAVRHSTCGPQRQSLGTQGFIWIIQSLPSFLGHEQTVHTASPPVFILSPFFAYKLIFFSSFTSGRNCPCCVSERDLSVGGFSGCH
jgi:hypothetical protein